MAIERDDTAMAFPAFRSGSFATDPTDPGPDPTAGSGGQCPDENTLVLLAEGVLDGSDRAAIDRHLDTCAACSMLVAELARLAAPAQPRAAPQRYKVIRQLGAGAMGVVWEAEDTSLHRRVALKFVKPENTDDPGLRKRLLREARALAQVRHPNVMALYDAGEADDEVCLVLELIDGTNARAWRDATPRTTAEILDVWKQAAAGIAAVHKAGIVHRDIKPDNVFVAAGSGPNSRRVLVGDFGLATGDGVNSTTSLTVSGAVIGTPLYMSPEQLQGKTASTLSDQFALCASIWEGVVGERPFRGSTIAAVVLAMSKLPELPKTVDPEQRRILAAIHRGLDPDPSKRFADVAALILELEKLDRPEKKKRGWLWFSGALVLAIGSTVAVLAATSGSRDAGSNAAGSNGSNAAAGSAEPAKPAPGVAPPAQPAKTEPAAIAPDIEPKIDPKTDPKIEPRVIAKQVPVPPTGPAAKVPGTTIKEPAPNPAEPIVREDLSFTHLMQRAADKLNYGDGAGCLKLLAQLPDVPDDQMVGVDLVKIECRMATGDCAGAQSAMTAYGTKQGWDEARTKTFYEGADRAYCPIEAPPASRQGDRAQYRLTVAASRGGSCKVIQDAIKKHNITLPDPKAAAFMEVQCMVNVGDCAGAKTKYLDILVSPKLDPSARPKVEEDLAKSFHTTYKKCPPS